MAPTLSSAPGRRRRRMATTEGEDPSGTVRRRRSIDGPPRSGAKSGVRVVPKPQVSDLRASWHCAGAALVLQWCCMGTAVGRVLSSSCVGTARRVGENKSLVLIWFCTRTALAPCWYCAGRVQVLRLYHTCAALALHAYCSGTRHVLGGLETGTRLGAHPYHSGATFVLYWTGAALVLHGC